jgi:hypothetical protein
MKIGVANAIHPQLRTTGITSQRMQPSGSGGELEPQDSRSLLKAHGRNGVGQAFQPDVRLESLTYNPVLSVPSKYEIARGSRFSTTNRGNVLYGQIQQLAALTRVEFWVNSMQLIDA